MSKVVVFTDLTLDGVMQAPGRPGKDRRGGFEHSGWATPYAAMAQAGESMSYSGLSSYSSRDVSRKSSIGRSVAMVHSSITPATRRSCFLQLIFQRYGGAASLPAQALSQLPLRLSLQLQAALLPHWSL